MKKTIISLLLACAMMFGLSTVAFAADEVLQPTFGNEDLVSVSGTEAIAHISDENALFLDLRAAADFAAGHIKGSVSAPVCLPGPGYEVTLANQEAFVAQMAELKVAENNTTLYLSCYAGTFCVNYAATWLTELCGVSEDQLVRVNGGTFAVNGDTSLADASIHTSPEYALAADGIILDVRNTDVYYNDGYVDGSIHLPLFSASGIDVNDFEDDLSKAFLAYANKYKAELGAKPIYILCNSGSKGAQKATALLNKVGLDAYTIDGGAKALKNIEGALVKQQFIEDAAEVISASKNSNSGIVILNVRTAANYDKGHLKGAINVPVFGANGASNGYDDVADSFLAGVEAVASKLEGKTIYVMCNGGASGAKAATKLLMRAGYSNNDIWTVKGGYNNPEIKPASIYVSSAQALSVIGNENYVILDVRKAAAYEAGHLKGSLSAPLFNDAGVTNGSDDLAKAFTEFVTGNKDLEGKTIYVLCNSGSRGAENATILLNAAGYTDVWTIDGGYNLNQDIQAATKEPVVDDTDKEETKEEDKTPSTDKTENEVNKAPATGDATPVMMYVVAMLACAAVVVSRRKSFK